MNPNDAIQGLFLRGGAHDLILRTNIQKHIASYDKVTGLANKALGISFEVLDGSNIYYVNKQDLINALGIVDPNVTDLMIETELKWQRMLPAIQAHYDVEHSKQLIDIPGAKEYLRGLAGGTPDSGLKPFVQNFIRELTKLPPHEREILFKVLLDIHYEGEDIPENANITPLYPFIDQVMGWPDKSEKISLLSLFSDGVGDQEFHDEALSLALNEFNRLLDEKLNEMIRNRNWSSNARSVWSDISVSNKGLQKIVNNLVVRNPDLLCETIDLFPLNEEQKNAIALKLAETETYALIYNIERFTLSQEQKNAIAWKLAETAPRDLCLNLERFSLSKEHLNTIALKLAETVPESLCMNIYKFYLNEEQKYAIALKLAETIPTQIYLYIKDFYLSEEQKNAIALKLAVKVARDLCLNLERFTLSQEQKNAIAWKLAETAPRDLCDKIEKFSLSDEQKNALALVFVQREPGALCTNIKKFSLSDEQKKALALEFVQRAPGALCENIEKFCLSDEQKNSVALQLAQAAPRDLCYNIGKFPLSDEQKNALALQFVLRAPGALCDNINEFPLSEVQKNAIALQLAQAAPRDLCFNIEKFSLSKEQKNGLALQLAQAAPRDLCYNIGKFSLSDEQKKALALQFVQTEPEALCYNIGKFSLSDEQKNALALQFVLTAPEALYRTRKEFTLNQEQSYVLTLKLIKIGNLYLEDILPQLSFDVKDKFECIIYSLILKINEDSLLKSEGFARFFGLNEEFTALLKSLEENEIPDVSWLRKYLDNKTPFVQQNVLKWFYKVQILCKLYEPISGVLESKVLEQIIKCSAGNRYLMTKKLLELHLPHQAEALQMWQQLEDKAKNAVHVQIPSVLLASLPPEMKETCMSVLEKIKSKSEREFLRQGPNQALLIATLHLLSESSLSSELKKRLLEGLFEVPLDQRKEVWRLVTDLINLGGGDEITVPLSLEGLKGSLERFFNKKFQIQVEGFYNKFVNTIGRWRNQEALMTWAGGLETLREDNKEKAHRFFQDFMRYVLEGDFSGQRMALENPHLEKIFKDRSDLKKAWVEEVSLAAEEMAVQKSELKEEEPGERVKRLFATQFLVDRHLGGAEQEIKYPHLTQYLNNPQEGAASIQKISAKMSELEAKVQEGLSMKARNQALAKLKEGDDYKGLQIERAALELLLNAEPSLIKEKTEALIKLLPPNNEFRHDLSGLLHEQSTNASVYTVLDSDHPNDFLLMGTEVENSCQRVNGNPSLNCCILGYALDAKHRLALVKDEEGHIVARSVLRLLIDSEGKPVLFQERVYVANPDPQLPALIRKVAMKKAESLRIPLLVSPRDFGYEGSEPYKHSISAGEKPVPFEYVDALGGRQPEAYKILDARLVVE